MDFTGKTVLVTGGGTGLGRAVSLLLAAQGAEVAVNYNRSQDEAEQTVREIAAVGGTARSFKADVSDEKAVLRMMEKVENRFGKLDYLVNNAGITRQLELSDLSGVTDEMWDTLFSVNVRGMFYCTRAAAALLRRQKGSAVLNVGSIAGITGSGSSLPYAVSKAAVHGLTKSLARSLAPDIRVNGVAPAAISTGWWKGEEEKMRRLSGILPLKRISTPGDIARLIACLLQQESMTGQIISPNNGMVIA